MIGLWMLAVLGAEEPAVTHARIDLVEGTPVVHDGVTLSVSDLTRAEDPETASCTLVGERGEETARLELARVEGAPPSWTPLLGHYVALDAVADGSASIVLTETEWTAEHVLERLAAAREKRVDQFDDAELDVVHHLGLHAELFVGKPSSTFTDLLGPSERAWGVPGRPDQLRWEIGRTPDTRRSGAPMLVVVHREGVITDVRVALPR